MTHEAASCSTPAKLVTFQLSLKAKVLITFKYDHDLYSKFLVYTSTAVGRL